MAELRMPNFGADWINALEGGIQRGRANREQNAMSYAGQAFAAGDHDAGENRLLQEGMTRQAGEFSELARARQTRTTQRNVATAMQNAGPNATQVQRSQAGADAALAGGDTEQYTQMIAQVNAGTRETREQFVQSMTFVAQQAQALQQVPEANRMQAAIQAIQGTPFDNPQIRAQIEQLGADGRITNEELSGLSAQVLTVRDQIDLRNDQRDFDEQRRQFGMNYNLQSRQVAAQEAVAQREATGELTYNQRRIASDQHNQRIRAVEGDLGILRPALPYANVVVRANGDPEQMRALGLTVSDMRAADIRLLRGAARAGTGPGVLTQAEVLGTLSTSLQQQVREQGAFFDASRVTLAPEDRLTLARLVHQNANEASRASWEQYGSATAILPPGSPRTGFNAPTLPHWEDMGQLNSSAGNYQVGRDYITRGGRRYNYAAPGEWVYRGEQQQPAGAQAPSQPQQSAPTSFSTMSRAQLERYSPQQITAMTPQQRAAFLARAREVRGQ